MSFISMLKSKYQILAFCENSFTIQALWDFFLNKLSLFA